MMSSFRRSLGVVAGASALMLFSATYDSQAQEPTRSRSTAKTPKKVVAPVVDDEEDAPAPKSTSKKNSDPHRRVYPYFGQLGLSEQQRESIYKIRAKHAPKVDALEKQLEETRSQALTEAEKVLTPAQKKALEERRKAAHATTETKAAGEMKAATPAADPTTTTPAKKRRGRDDR